MGETLSIDAIRFACEADAIPQGRWKDVTEEMFLIHQVVMDLVDRPKGK